MTLILNKSETYADPYRTNWFYLRNMTSLQMKALEEINWDERYKVIQTSLWGIPWSFKNGIYTENSVKEFIIYLNDEIKEL